LLDAFKAFLSKRDSEVYSLCKRQPAVLQQQQHTLAMGLAGWVRHATNTGKEQQSPKHSR
jgi:hypothetical protein